MKKAAFLINYTECIWRSLCNTFSKYQRLCWRFVWSKKSNSWVILIHGGFTMRASLLRFYFYSISLVRIKISQVALESLDQCKYSEGSALCEKRGAYVMIVHRTKKKVYFDPTSLRPFYLYPISAFAPSSCRSSLRWFWGDLWTN